MVKHSKWCINVGKWKPTCDQWLRLTSSVANEELTRINRFAYQEDSKSSLVGRALIRKFISDATEKPSNELRLARTEFGRPVVCQSYVDQLASSWPKLLDFNVSHSGDYCVLAGIWSYETISCPDITVGVDVTKIVNKNSKQELDRFLDLMSRREFTKSEWDTVERAPNDRQKCINFTRLWCLKESFIKSIGLGLSFRLNRISFNPEENQRYTVTMEMLKNKIISDTTVTLDGLLAHNWHFQETALDNEHLVAVGYNLRAYDQTMADVLLDKSPFVEISIDSLVGSLVPIAQAKEENWVKFKANATKSI